MRSTSDSDYLSGVWAFLDEVRARPEMFVRSTRDLELVLYGHAVGWCQFASLDRSKFFDRRFSPWLRRTTGGSVALGWGSAVEAIATERGVRSLDLAFELIDEYKGTLP